MGAIVVGGAAVNRATTFTTGYTVIILDNPSNGTGKITDAQIYLATDVTGLIIAVFRLVSGVTYRCISAVAVGSLSAGLNNISGLSLDIAAGDFIGFYVASGTVDLDVSGGSGVKYRSGNYATVGSSVTYGDGAGYIGSLYGTGVTPAPAGGSPIQAIMAGVI